MSLELLEHPTIRRLTDRLAVRPAVAADDDGAPARAAVALPLRVGRDETVELLLIRRATREGDPWSGQVALPGGRWSPADESLIQTALRETREETGLDLASTGMIIGTLDELRPRTPVLPPIIVTPFVAVTVTPTQLILSDEVADAFWVSLNELADPTASREAQVDVRGAVWKVPSLVVGEHIVWGMTERILRQLLALLD